MSDKDKNFTGSIPDVYDDFLVPLIFTSFAQDMAQRVARTKPKSGPKSVLETAAGSGVVTRALAPMLADDARYMVTDLNPPMLERGRHQQPADARITWQQADAMALPFEADSFDALCCQFGVMFFPDKAAGFREASRVLRAGGHFIFNVWDHIEHNEFAQSVTATAARFFPDDPPEFLARTPHGYHDVAAISATLRAAGFRTIEVTTITKQSRAADPHMPAYAYCQGTPLRNELIARDANCLEQITTAAATDIQRTYGAGPVGTGPVSAKIQGHVFVAGK